VDVGPPANSGVAVAVRLADGQDRPPLRIRLLAPTEPNPGRGRI